MVTVFDTEKILTKFPLKHRNAITLALAFPNAYNIGITSLGYQTAWKLFNQSEDIRVVRWFTDCRDIQWPLSIAYIGFSFSWELDYKNIFSMLDKNNIPLHTKDRKEEDPIVFCGGQVPNANFEPFCENFDFFIIGDLEAIVLQLTEKIYAVRNLKRNQKIQELSNIRGVYTPSSTKIKRQFTASLQNFAFSSILTPHSIWPNTFLVEVARGCPELCRFCLASYGSLPFRTQDIKESLLPIIDFGLKHTNKIGLLGASVTHHPQFEGLLDYLLSSQLAARSSNLQVQIASVRADTISKPLAEGLFKLGAKSLTMAVETGSEKLRDIINKKVSNKTILNSIQTIYNTGFNSIKLYGIVGLPEETDDDLKQTVDFLKQIKSRNKTKKIAWGCSVFVPKATTPFYKYGVDKNANKKLQYLAKELHQIGVDFRPESFKWSQIQALISRGNRSVNKILELAYRYGNTLGSFKKAIRELKDEVDSDYFIFESWDRTV